MIGIDLAHEVLTYHGMRRDDRLARYHGPQAIAVGADLREIGWDVFRGPIQKLDYMHTHFQEIYVWQGRDDVFLYVNHDDEATTAEFKTHATIDGMYR